MTMALLDEASEVPPDASGKRRQILDGARSVFLNDGFDGASMNDIARVAGVSKGTLYVYFSSKEQLFEALIREDRRQQAERTCDLIDYGQGPEVVLANFGRSLISMMARPETFAHFRMVVGVVLKFPRLGAAFFEAGPQYGALKLKAYLESQIAAGTMTIRDTERASWQFIELCKSGLYLPVVFGLIDHIEPKAIDENVQAAIEVFMAAYGAKPAQ